jgi:hypothetical protein
MSKYKFGEAVGDVAHPGDTMLRFLEQAGFSAVLMVGVIRGDDGRYRFRLFQPELSSLDERRFVLEQVIAGAQETLKKIG